MSTVVINGYKDTNYSFTYVSPIKSLLKNLIKFSKFQFNEMKLKRWSVIEHLDEIDEIVKFSYNIIHSII